MDEHVQRENRRHRMDYYKVPQVKMECDIPISNEGPECFPWNTKFGMLCEERDAAIRERDRALAEKKAALVERDVAIQQRDAALQIRDNTLRERDNAIVALQFQDSTMNALGGVARGMKRTNHPTNQHFNNVTSAHSLGEGCITDALPISAIPPKAAKSVQVTKTKVKKNVTAKSTKSPSNMRKMREDLNRHVTTDGSKAEWDAQEFDSIDLIHFDESTMPAPVCSCIGPPWQCYKWGSGGRQSSCCTTLLSVYPLPQMPNKKHGQIGGRKMSGSVFSRLLTRAAAAAAGHDLSIPIDLKSYWAKHGTNLCITIK